MQKTEYPELAPGICFICEQTPQVTYVDTLRDYHDLALVHRLSGRKYICSNCVQELAEVMGYSAAREHSLLKEEFLHLKDDYALLRREYNKVQEAVSKDFLGMVAKMAKATTKKPKGGK